jgi:phosphoribosylpyrophosphate synthetase
MSSLENLTFPRDFPPPRPPSSSQDSREGNNGRVSSAPVTARAYRNNGYICLAEETISFMPKTLQLLYPERFKYFPIHWHKFPDGTDNITIDGFYPDNEIFGENVIFFASFYNNDITLSQFSVLIVLLQSFIQSLTVVLPFYPVGTNERVEIEGRVATANTYSILFSSLPSIGKPIRLMIYDIHALQNRFYFHGSTTPSLHSAMPLLLKRIKETDISAVVFPDEGASKRYGKFFSQYSAHLQRIVCGKVRDGNQRIVTIQDGNAEGK